MSRKYVLSEVKRGGEYATKKSRCKAADRAVRAARRRAKRLALKEGQEGL